MYTQGPGLYSLPENLKKELENPRFSAKKFDDFRSSRNVRKKILENRKIAFKTMWVGLIHLLAPSADDMAPVTAPVLIYGILYCRVYEVKFRKAWTGYLGIKANIKTKKSRLQMAYKLYIILFNKEKRIKVLTYV